MSQIKALENLLLDGEPHSTVEIMKVVYGGSHLGLARVGARIFDLKKKYTINGWKDSKNPAIYWYQMKPLKVIVPEWFKPQELVKQKLF